MVAALVSGLAAPAPAEVVLSFYGGFQTAPHSNVHDSVLGDAHVGWDGKSFAAPPYYGVRATWWRNEAWGWGLDFNHAKVYADDPAAYGYDWLEFSDGLNIATLNLWRRWQNEGKWTPYVGAGIGIAVPHVEIQRTGEARTFGYQLTGPAIQLVAGVSYDLSDRWAIFGEYKGTYSRNKAEVDTGGTFETDIITNAVNLGVSFRF